MNWRFRVALASVGTATAALGVGFAACGPTTWTKNSVATLSCAAILALWGLFAEGRERCFGGRLTLFFVVGLLFSVLGDRFMSIRGADERLFLAGIGAFFLAHSAFFIGFLSRRDRRRRFWAFAAFLFVALVPYFAGRLAPSIESSTLLAAATAYLTISILSLSGAFAVDFRPIARASAICGVASIVVSDVFIAEGVFKGATRCDFLIIPMYLATHFGLTASVLLDGALRARDD